MDLINAYHTLLNQNNYTADEAQQAGIYRLQTLYNELNKGLSPSHGLSTSLWSGLKQRLLNTSKPKPRGVWLWGGVGRGKSFLMDCFYNQLPNTLNNTKIRIHFHEFMHSVHQELQQLKQTKTVNPLNTVAKNIAIRYQVLCFDEFHVSDVADAMILHHLLEALFDYGVTFVMTSNYPPDGLYPDGLHRDRILPAIALLNLNLDVLNIDAGIDYRRRDLTYFQTYWVYKNDAINDTINAINEVHLELNHIFNAFMLKHDITSDDKPEIFIENRTITAHRKAQSMIWFTFEQLCSTARSQNDYLELACTFETIIVTDVPKLTPNQASSARRLTWLIDVLYDHKVKLLMAAHTSVDTLYEHGQYANEFHRTVSRMIEMQSQEYLDSERRLTVSL